MHNSLDQKLAGLVPESEVHGQEGGSSRAEYLLIAKYNLKQTNRQFSELSEFSDIQNVRV